MSEYIYAVLDGEGKVANIVTADNDDAITALSLLIPDAAEIVLTTDVTGAAYIGGDMFDDRFRMPKPYLSWVWDSEAGSWIAPVPYPEGGNGYTWDEETVSWVEIPAPVVEGDDA